MDRCGRMATSYLTGLPKVELHAHLNGSLSEETVRELMAKNLNDIEMIGSLSAETVIEKGTKRTLKDCFDMFKVIQKLTVSNSAIKYATKAVIDDFVEDGVCYLELRSTPRSNTATGLTKRSYIEAVLEGIKEYSSKNTGAIDVRFLLSIDRRLGIKEAEDTVQLAVEYKAFSKGLVVGIDFSGDPNASDGRDYINILKKAKDSGLKLSIHMAEIRGLDQENEELLMLPPDRIGHGTFLHESSLCENMVKENKWVEVEFYFKLLESMLHILFRIPLEICLTSNVKGGTVDSYAEEHHHMHRWMKVGQPIVLCTDDKGVFSTTLSNEYRIAARECEMSRKQLFLLSKSAIDCIFASDDVKAMLRTKWDNWREHNADLLT